MTLQEWVDRYPGDPEALIDALVEETERLRRDREQYNDWAEEIRETVSELRAEIERLRGALERIALLDEADGHELNVDHAFKAVAIATSTLGKHPSELCADRRTAELTSREPSEADMRAFSASDAACYKWPEDTPEHKALRAAYIEGAADCGGSPVTSPDRPDAS